jgi:predicted nucleic acid-binding Zn ribbon protein
MSRFKEMGDRFSRDCQDVVAESRVIAELMERRQQVKQLTILLWLAIAGIAVLILLLIRG